MIQDVHINEEQLPTRDNLGRYEFMCDGCPHLDEEYWYRCRKADRLHGDRISCMGCIRPDWCPIDGEIK